MRNMQGRVFTLTKEDVDALPSIILGIIPTFESDAKVLIDQVLLNHLFLQNFCVNYYEI